MKQQQALLFADMAHRSINQKRKYTGDPYIVHPINVAYLVKIAGGSDEMICAAYLHDVLEDVAPQRTTYNRDAIHERFGEKVLEMVEWLTDSQTKDDGNRQFRKNRELHRISEAPSDVKTIKLADLIDNSQTICAHDPGFASLYLKEKRNLLEVLKDGDSNLWGIANNILIKEGY